MSLLVVGTVAIDTVETPFGRAENVIGGSATFSVYAASYFVGPRMLAVVGEDFPKDALDELSARGVDLAGLKVDPEGKTFHWTGRYEGDMSDAQTLGVSLNVTADSWADVPAVYRDSEYVLLANEHPRTQLDVLDAVEGDPFTLADTRDIWITEEPELLGEVMGRVDGMVLNDSEARMLTGERNLVRAGRAILGRGPDFVVVKKGEHGSILLSGDAVFALPACPLEEVRDPTGAGDSFAGGLMGYLASTGKRSLEAIKRGLTYGTVAASVAVEDFSVAPFRRVDKRAFSARHDEFVQQIRF